MTNPLIAQAFPASREAAEKVLAMPVGDHGRSDYTWLLLANGDLMLGVWPTGDGYFEVEIERELDYDLAVNVNTLSVINQNDDA